MIVLVASPSYDTATRYTYHYKKLLAEKLVTEGKAVIWLGERYSPDVFRDFSCASDVIVAAGHGAPNKFTGYNGELIWDPDTLGCVRNRGVHLLSCLTGQNLGKEIVRKGGKWFIGYKEEFVFVSDKSKRIHEDELARPFFEIDNLIDERILLHKWSPKRAYEFAKKKYSELGEKFLEINTEVSSWLFWNGENLVFYERGKERFIDKIIRAIRRGIFEM